MRMYDILIKKRNGGALSDAEIRFLVKGFTEGEIPDYQMASFLMAVWFRGMTKGETVSLTLAMAESGGKLDLSGIKGIKVDKHSTGGVGDKTTLIVGPILASLQVPVAKMSGRGLGHTGGTIDKLESIPGFCTSIATDVFIRNVNQIHFALAGQTADLAPADKKIYALRDVTGTVDSDALIASSIMSKKIASGADAIVLDVKCGTGGFMKTSAEAERLAELMVEIGRLAGRKTVAVISDMNEPLGRMVGNSLEVMEAVEILSDGGDGRLRELCTQLAVEMLLLSGRLDGEEEKDRRKQATDMVIDAIVSRRALHRFAEFVEAQGGNPDYIYHTDRFEKASYVVPVPAVKSGRLTACDAEEVGMTSLILGAGRSRKDEAVDFAAGIELMKKLGDTVQEGETMAYLYTNRKDVVPEAISRFQKAYTIENREFEPEKVIKKIIS